MLAIGGLKSIAAGGGSLSLSGPITAQYVKTTGAISPLTGSTQQTLSSFDATTGALWLAQGSPSSTNYSVAKDGNNLYLAGSGTGPWFQIALATGVTTINGQLVISTATAPQIQFSGAATNQIIAAAQQQLQIDNANGNTTGTVAIGPNTTSGVSLGRSGIQVTQPAVVGTPASGTGVTANYSGAIRHWVHKVTITNAAMAAAATTDITLHVTPVNTRIIRVTADVTQVFTGGALSAMTITCGNSAGGNQYLLSNSVFTAQNTWGKVAAEIGAGLLSSTVADMGTVSAGVPGAITVQTRFTATGANCNAATQGSVTFYVEGVTY